MTEKKNKKPFVTKRSAGCLGVGCLAIVLLFVLFCSGLNFPVMGKQSSLEGRIRDDFGLAPPGSLRVVNAARQAYRDPAYFYECDVPAPDGATFMAKIEGTATTRRYDLRSERAGSWRLLGPAAPAWFEPEADPDVVNQGVLIPKDGTGYRFFFSAKRGKLFVLWFAT